MSPIPPSSTLLSGKAAAITPAPSSPQYQQSTCTIFLSSIIYSALIKLISTSLFCTVVSSKWTIVQYILYFSNTDYNLGITGQNAFPNRQQSKWKCEIEVMRSPYFFVPAWNPNEALLPFWVQESSFCVKCAPDTFTKDTAQDLPPTQARALITRLRS